MHEDFAKCLMFAVAGPADNVVLLVTTACHRNFSDCPAEQDVRGTDHAQIACIETCLAHLLHCKCHTFSCGCCLGREDTCFRPVVACYNAIFVGPHASITFTHDRLQMSRPFCWYKCKKSSCELSTVLDGNGYGKSR